MDEIRHSIEKSEAIFRGKGFYDDMVVEIAYSYTKDGVFRREIQEVIVEKDLWAKR